MSIQNQVAMCTEHYKRWKDTALATGDKKAMEKAFFWLELQSAFMALHAIEQVKGTDSTTKRKLIIAKTNLSKKLADYANEVLNEIKLR